MAAEADSAHYLELWVEVKTKLQVAAKLDPGQEDKPDIYMKPSRLMFGASFHGYQCASIRESKIRAIEREHSVTLPLNFRTFLLVCGGTSTGKTGGPGYGIDTDLKYLSSDLLKPCPYEARKGIGFTLEEDGTSFPLGEEEYIFNPDGIYSGTIEIGNSGNPAIHYLVVSGQTRGDVFTYTGDMLFYEGSFESWYMKWLDKTMDELESGDAQRRFDRDYVPRRSQQ